MLVFNIHLTPADSCASFFLCALLLKCCVLFRGVFNRNSQSLLFLDQDLVYCGLDADHVHQLHL